MNDIAAPRVIARPDCPVCGKPGPVRHAGLQDRAHAIPGTYGFRACAACHLGWLDPRPVDADIALAYPTEYYTHSAPAAAPAIPTGTGAKAAVRALVLNACLGYRFPAPAFPGADLVGRALGLLPPVRYRLAYRADRALPPWRAGGRLLDIGCGDGSFLTLVQSLGWTPAGIEPDPAAAAVARRRTGAMVEASTLEATGLKAESFDAVTTMHSIEHAVDPREFLRAALRLLRPGGHFYLQTPNFESLMHARAGADWYALETPRHLCILSVPALRRLLTELSGWSSLSVRSLPRRARREQEHVLAVRRAGNFHAAIARSRRDEAEITAWAAIEHLGNRAMNWGEEVEVIGTKA